MVARKDGTVHAEELYHMFEEVGNHLPRQPHSCNTYLLKLERPPGVLQTSIETETVS